MIKYEIRDYGNAGLMLVRIESREPTEGLPPTFSSCIIFQPEELSLLMETLKDYANKR